MPDPFDSKLFDTGLRPFFNDRVVIEAKRPNGTIRGTFAACIFRGMADPLSDGAIESTVATLTVLVAKTGEFAWNHPDDPPRIGDVVTIPCGASFAVTSRDDLVTDHYHLEARQI